MYTFATLGTIWVQVPDKSPNRTYPTEITSLKKFTECYSRSPGEGLIALRGRATKGLLAQKGQDASTIVLCHNSDAADRPVWGQYQGWILAGHTHGGQCKPPFLPPPLLPVKNKRYVAGKFELPGNRHMYISRGVGHLLRVRFNVRPEIAVFRLRVAD